MFPILINMHQSHKPAYRTLTVTQLRRNIQRLGHALYYYRMSWLYHANAGFFHRLFRRVPLTHKHAHAKLSRKRSLEEALSEYNMTLADLLELRVYLKQALCSPEQSIKVRT